MKVNDHGGHKRIYQTALIRKVKEEEAHDRVVAAVLPQNDWVADIGTVMELCMRR